MEVARSLYTRLQHNIDNADPRTKDWLLVWSNPVYVWALTAFYLVFIFLGPRVMRDRKPFDLKGFLIVYNLSLVALSLYMFIETWLSAIHADYNLVCQPYNEETIKNPAELRMANVLWWYFFSKAIELMDTVLMVLRKKNNQISFLHWFHHASMLNIWWWVMMWIPGGCSFFGSSINCFIHVVMYTYYALAAIPSLRGKLWWKKYITRMQLLQFCITLSHTVLVYFLDCGFPKWGVYLLGGYMIIMLILFSNFYIHTYLKAAAARKAQANSIANGTANGTANGATANGTTSPVQNGVNGHAKKYD